MAEQRQLTGVMATVLDQRPEGYTVYKAVNGLNTQGKITPSGLITVPLSSGQVLQSAESENPSITDVSGNTPAIGQTKESAQQTGKFNPAWLLLGLLFI